MRFKSPLIRGTLLQRYKRFLADVRLDNDEIVTAHCTNTGSMMGCKEPGSPVYLSRSNNLNRKLLYTWELVKTDGTWVGINTLHPNKLVPEAVESGVIDDAEAKRRRLDVQREADFYGAMDGASKFVKGDAMAGILIVLLVRRQLVAAVVPLLSAPAARAIVPPAFLGASVGFSFMMFGIAHAPAAISTVLLATTPIVALFVDTWRGDAKISARGLVGTALAVAGVGLLTWSSS